MESWKAMKDAVGGKTANMSAQISLDGWRLAPDTLYQYQEQYGGTFSGSPNCIDRVNRVIEASKKIGNPYKAWSSPIHALCHEHGHIAVRLPEKQPGMKDLQQGLLKSIKEFSDLASASSEAMESGDVDKREAANIIKQGEEALQQISAYIEEIKASVSQRK